MTTTTTTYTADLVDTGWTATYTENGTPVSISDTDLSIFDADSANMVSGQITLTNPQSGDRLLVNGSAAASGSIGSISWTRTDTSVTFSGVATKAQYAAAIALVQFENTGDMATPAHTTPRSITVVVNDGSANSNIAVATISIDRTPDLIADAASGSEDTAISGNVAANDTDLGDGGGAFAVATGPANGTLTSFNTSTGAFVYTPNANFNGTDTFTYSYTDADGDIGTATVTLTVNPMNDAPVNTLPGATNGSVGWSTPEDSSVQLTGLSVADVDAASGTITVTLNVGSGHLTAASGGGVTIAGSGTATLTLTGTLSSINAYLGSGAAPAYTPVANANGTVVLTMTTNDGGNTGAGGPLSDADNRLISITPVNDAPDAVNDSYTVAEDSGATTFAVLANDTISPDTGETLSITGVTQPVGGTVTFTATGVTFTPNANFNGSTTFTYTISDGNGGTDTATVTVNVTPVNDAPVNAVPVTIGPMNEDGTLAVSGLSVADVDSGTLTTTVTVTNGALSLGVTGGASVSGGGTGTLTLVGTASQINTALATLSFAPVADYNGSASFQIATTDGTLTDTDSRTIAIQPVADITNDTVSVNEDTTLNFNVLTGTNGATADTFEGSPVVTSFTQPANGTVTIDAAGNVVFVPDANFNGTDSFTYTVTSGGVTETATVSVTVNAVNDAPTQTVPGAQATAEDTVLAITGTSVADVDGGALTTTISIPAGTGGLSVVTGGGATITGNGGTSVTISGTAAQINAALATISYTPAADYNGSVALSVLTSDGSLSAVGSIAITVSPVADITNDTVSVNEDTTLNFNVLTGTNGATADTFEGLPVVTSYTQPANGTVTIDAAGNVVFVPNANFNGSDSFTYTVTSGGVTETATVSVTVNAVNDAPTQTVPGAQATAEDTDLVFSSANGNALSIADVDGNVTTTLSVANGTLTLGSIVGVTVTGNGTGTVTVSGSGAQVTAALSGLAFAPTADWNGLTTLNVSTSDGIAPATVSTVDISVTPVADIASNAGSTLEDTPLTINVLTNDSFENPGAVVSAVTQPANGTVSIGVGGNVTYTPDANFNGPDSFTYTVTSGGVTETTTVTMSVTSVNDAPVNTVPAAQLTNEDTALVFSSGNGNAITIADVDGNVTTTLTVGNGTLTLGSTVGVTVTGDGTGTVTISGTPTQVTAALAGLAFAPDADWSGATSLDISTTDGIAPATVSSVAITVVPVADITNDTVSVNEDTTLNFNVLTGTNGATADTFEGLPVVTSFTQPANGTVTIDAAGNVVFVPDANFNGSDSFTYTVTSGGVTETATVNVTVNAVNDAPTQTVPGAQATAEDTDLVFSSANGNALSIADVDGNVTTNSERCEWNIDPRLDRRRHRVR